MDSWGLNKWSLYSNYFKYILLYKVISTIALSISLINIIFAYKELHLNFIHSIYICTELLIDYKLEVGVLRWQDKLLYWCS